MVAATYSKGAFVRTSRAVKIYFVIPVSVAALSVASLVTISPANATNYSGLTGQTGCFDLNEADNASLGLS